jgi:hypothetical protein
MRCANNLANKVANIAPSLLRVYTTLTGRGRVLGVIFYPAGTQLPRVIDHSSQDGNPQKLPPGNTPGLLCRASKAHSGQVGARAMRISGGDLPHYLSNFDETPNQSKLSNSSSNQGLLSMGTQSGKCVIMGLHGVNHMEYINKDNYNVTR